MSDFKQYRRTQIAEMRTVTGEDVEKYQKTGALYSSSLETTKVSISDADLDGGSPKIGDMVARNPKNHIDQWLVAEKYFKENFEPL